MACTLIYLTLSIKHCSLDENAPMTHLGVVDDFKYHYIIFPFHKSSDNNLCPI